MKNKSWVHKAKLLKENREWLKYSSNISMRILAGLDESGKSRTDLAKILDVTTQYVDKLVKGKENLSLKTISKISKAVGLELISFPEFKYSRKPAHLLELHDSDGGIMDSCAWMSIKNQSGTVWQQTVDSNSEKTE